MEPELRPGPEVDQAVPAPGAFSVLRTYLPEGPTSRLGAR